MKFIHLHEILRLELLRRIQRGSLTVTLLARQTGLAQSHLSNFLRKKRRISQAALDLVLEAHSINVEDLLPSRERRGKAAIEEELYSVPIVSHDSALFEPVIRPAVVLAHLPTLPDALTRLLARPTADRRRWQRFVAVRIPAKDAEAMSPVIAPDAIVVIDRHYNSMRSYDPARPTLYAARRSSELVVRYVDFISDRLVLRSLCGDPPVELLEVAPGTRPQDLIAGRIVLIQNPM